jgi:allophanate hydrolase
VRAADRTPLDLVSLRRLYGGHGATPSQIVDDVIAAIEDAPEGIWIDRQAAAELRADARALEERYRGGQRPPLYGVPFGVKDSIDVAGVQTTVGCPAFRYIARETAPAVDLLRAAGALYVGKTNLDQFATGLVGVRSPYGIPPNPFDPTRITGGSSSGSAAAVARGYVSFALATDTAGSGRVPAAFNNVVGLKPSRGLISTRGLVPACRSVDCMTVVALTCEDARLVASLATGYDLRDPFSRAASRDFQWAAGALPGFLRLGIPRAEDRVFGDEAARVAFERACSDLATLGWELEPVDMGPFFEAGRLLYGGPWIAERLSGLQGFLHQQPESLLPVVRTILTDGERHRATDVFLAQHRLAELKRELEPVWARVRALVVPTAPSHPTIEAVLADPIAQNAQLGRYTTFGNLLDLAGVAVPVRFRDDGLPFGITLLGPWGTDAQLLDMAGAVHHKAGVTLGATGWPLRTRAEPAPRATEEGMLLAVVGAHLSGQPLNHQLTDAGARFVRTTRTSNHYKLFALPGTTPPKPGLVRSGPGGAAIELEIWELPSTEVGGFLAKVGPPLAIGTIDIEDGSRVHGFLCEGHGAEGAEDISALGGWRAYLSHRRH